MTYRQFYLIIIAFVSLLLIGAGVLVVRFVSSQWTQISTLESELSAMEKEKEKVEAALIAERAPPDIKIEPMWGFPIARSDYRLTDAFGLRPSRLVGLSLETGGAAIDFHNGLDIARPEYLRVEGLWRAQVVPVADGVVVDHWPPEGTPLPWPKVGFYQGHESYGGYVEILHVNGWKTRYGHLSWTNVHIGDRVRAGDVWPTVLGRTGNTGKSDGEHLHFEILDSDGNRLNPLLYIENPMDDKETDNDDD